MRLISTKDLQVVSIREDEIPPYAILSHTWDTDEVTLQDMQGFGAKFLSTASRINILTAKQGLEKVLDAAKLAALEGYDWIWIDTCCIDKASSSELSEAINSMYRWYQGSEICFVYLADAKLGDKELQALSDESLIQLIKDSRWITRGWTLQELIAPRSVSFYSKDWKFIGKSNEDRIVRLLAEATGIEIGVLSGDIATQEVSVANRMRWASGRKTTRQEDMAYCLMGLFSVNMPLLYGEGGARAFIRLQVEILQATDDQTIFAWSTPPGSKYHSGATGLLAESPAYFRDTPKMYPISDWYQSESSTPWSMTNRGLMVQLYLQPGKSWPNTKEDSVDDFVAILNCSTDLTSTDEYQREWVHEYNPEIFLRRLWGDQFARVDTYGCQYVRSHDRQGGQVKTVFVKQDQSISLPSFSVAGKFLGGTDSFIVSAVYPRDLWDSKSGILRSGLSRQRCIQGLLRFSYPPVSGATKGLFDVAVALQPNGPGRFEAVGILRPAEGRTVRQAYDQLNKTWISASQDGKAKQVDEYRDRMVVLLQLRRTQRFGGVSYLLDLLEKVELQQTVPNPHPGAAASITLEGLKDAKAPISAEGQLKSLFQTICVLETSQPGRLVPFDKRIRVRQRNGLLFETQGPKSSSNSTLTMSGSSKSKSISTVHTSPATLRPCRPSNAGESCKSIFHEIACDRPNTEDEICSVFTRIVAVLAQGNEISVVQENESGGSVKRVRYGISEDRIVHFAALRGDPSLTSWALDKCFYFKGSALTGTHIASILHNATAFRRILDQSGETASFTLKGLPGIRETLGVVNGTQDTALHLAATYSTKEEFERVMTTLTRTTDDLGLENERSDNFDINYKWNYLFRLKNGNGETILHRAAAMSNFGVVAYICEKAPAVACQLDSMSRSTLWHAACGGDDRIIHVIGTALQSLKWAPTVDYPDDNGLTPLHVACREGHDNCVKALLEHGASPLCAAQSSGLTPIHYASLFGHCDCLKAMANNPNSRSELIQVIGMVEEVDLTRPIHLAAANGWYRCVEFLANYGSPLDPLASIMCTVRDSPSPSTLIMDGQSSLDSLEVTEVQVQEIPKSTPRQVAAKRGWSEVESFLQAEELIQMGSRWEWDSRCN